MINTQSSCFHLQRHWEDFFWLYRRRLVAESILGFTGGVIILKLFSFNKNGVYDLPIVKKFQVLLSGHALAQFASDYS